nr:hypothetical protein Iba_chr08eCG7640 [Ipomoea batatas]
MDATLSPPYLSVVGVAWRREAAVVYYSVRTKTCNPDLSINVGFLNYLISNSDSKYQDIRNGKYKVDYFICIVFRMKYN